MATVAPSSSGADVVNGWLIRREIDYDRIAKPCQPPRPAAKLRESKRRMSISSKASRLTENAVASMPCAGVATAAMACCQMLSRSKLIAKICGDLGRLALAAGQPPHLPAAAI